MKIKIKWLRVLAIITFPLWIIPLMILGMLFVIVSVIIDTILALYDWCVESESKTKPLDYNEPHDYTDEYPRMKKLVREESYKDNGKII